MQVRWYVALLTPLLLFLAWPTYGWSPLIFISLVPLLLVIEYTDSKKPARRAFWISYLVFASFNAVNGYWIGNAHWSGTAAVIVINGAELALAFYGYAWIKKIVDIKRAYIALVAFWLTAESIHNFWEISWPWLFLGNVFSEDTHWVQWYEYTGFSGGTLWVLAVNIAVFSCIKQLVIQKNIALYSLRMGLYFVGWVLLPIGISLWMYSTWEESDQTLEVIVVQPNVDAYTEKFKATPKTAIDQFFSLAAEMMDEDVDLLMGPETMIPKAINESEIRSYTAVAQALKYRKRWPNTSLLFGASTYQPYYTEVAPTLSARPFPGGGGYYDMYNSALFFTPVTSPAVYHKSMLVVGVEKMPFMSILKPIMGEVAIDLGGTAGSLGVQVERDVYPVGNNSVMLGAAICYESVYGEYYGGFVRKGAQVMAIITNDDWWGNTPGHRQHFSYARLRAIECRRAIARSANTGISGFINSRGDVVNRLGYKEQGVLRAALEVRNKITFYTQYGDLLVRTAWFVGLVLILSTWVKRRTAS